MRFRSGFSWRVHRRRDVLTHEIAIDLCCDELAGDGLLEDDADDVVAVERALLAEERLLTEVMLRGIELIREDVVGPAREGAGRFTDVALGVVADAHREQLEQFAPEVLVRVRLHVLAVVEIDEHRGILEDPDQQILQAT